MSTFTFGILATYLNTFFTTVHCHKVCSKLDFCQIRGHAVCCVVGPCSSCSVSAGPPGGAARDDLTHTAASSQTESHRRTAEIQRSVFQIKTKLTHSCWI